MQLTCESLQALSILFLKISLHLQLLNKACSVKWRRNTRESIIQLSRFPLSLQMVRDSESDHCIGVGAGEHDCFYQHKRCFNRVQCCQSLWLAVMFSGKSVRVKRKEREHEAEKDLWKTKLKSYFQIWNSWKSYTASYTMFCLVVECTVCVCVCLHFNKIKSKPWQRYKLFPGLQTSIYSNL